MTSATDTTFANTRPRVLVNGRDGGRFVDATLSVVVEMPADGMDGAEVRLQNWSGGERDVPGPVFDDVALGDDIVIAMGAGDGSTVFDGHVTGIEERYGDGAPQIVLLAEDRLHLLARMRASRVIEDTSVDDLVALLAQEAGLSGEANVSSDSATWHQLNESHLAFLRRVLHPHRASLRVRDGSTVVARPHEPAAQPVRLDATDNALSVRVVADLNRQYTSVTSRGFDPSTGDRVESEATSVTGAFGTTAPSTLGEVGWTAAADVPTPFVTRQVDAEVAAQGALDAAASRFLHGHVTCEGDPALVTDGEIELVGVSERLAGVYAIDHCVHHFDAQDGYRTQLAISRPEWQS